MGRFRLAIANSQHSTGGTTVEGNQGLGILACVIGIGLGVASLGGALPAPFLGAALAVLVYGIFSMK